MAKKRKKKEYKVINIVPELSEEERKRREQKTIDIMIKIFSKLNSK